MNVLITGAAGNLGSLLARYILKREDDLSLILMQHEKRVPSDLSAAPHAAVRFGDLSQPDTLDRCLSSADVIVHFAGVLFKANPEQFLYDTNVVYFRNLVDAAKRQGVRKIILISFPHVEGPTSRENPATGRLDRVPISVHAKTRLEAEQYLFRHVEQPISLRVGMVYGKGILMIDAAQWLARWKLLCVWRKPTDIHLISKTDFCRATVAAIKQEKAAGVYHIGDEGRDTLQSFLDYACDLWGYSRPRRVPLPLIYLAAGALEFASQRFNIASPLTKDFIDIGRISYYGDTSRFRRELLPRLVYRSIRDGVADMRG